MLERRFTRAASEAMVPWGNREAALHALHGREADPRQFHKTLLRHRPGCADRLGPLPKGPLVSAASFEIAIA